MMERLAAENPKGKYKKDPDRKDSTSSSDTPYDTIKKKKKDDEKKNK